MARNSNKNKTPIIITAFILVVVILIAYIALAIWRGTYNPTQWVNKPTTDITKPDDTGNKPNTPDTPDKPNKPNTPTGTEPENDELIIEEIASNGISLMSMPIAHSSDYISTQRVTVTVLPSAATDKEYTVSFNWENASSAWANGKNVSDYVEYSETGNAAEIDINMKERFGEIITGRFALKNNPEIYAETKIGCYYQTEEFYISATDRTYLYLTESGEEYLNLYNNSDDGGSYEAFIGRQTPANWNVSDSKQQVNIGERVSTGTRLKIQESSCYYTVERSESLQAAMSAAGIDGGKEYAYKAHKCSRINWESLFSDNVFGNIDTMEKYAKLIDCLKQCQYDILISFNIKTSNGTTYKITFNVNILDSSLNIAAGDIQAPPEIIL